MIPEITIRPRTIDERDEQAQAYRAIAGDFLGQISYAGYVSTSPGCQILAHELSTEDTAILGRIQTVELRLRCFRPDVNPIRRYNLYAKLRYIGDGRRFAGAQPITIALYLEHKRAVIGLSDYTVQDRIDYDHLLCYEHLLTSLQMFQVETLKSSVLLAWNFRQQPVPLP